MSICFLRFSSNYVKESGSNRKFESVIQWCYGRCEMVNENQVFDIENRFINLTNELLEKNNKIDSEYKKKEENCSSRKKNLAKWVNDHKVINDHDSSIRSICCEFSIELDIHNIQSISIGNELEEYSLLTKINSLDHEAYLICQDVLNEAIQARKIKDDIKEENRKMKEHEELEIIKVSQAKLNQELEIQRIKDEDQYVQAARAKKKEDNIAVIIFLAVICGVILFIYIFWENIINILFVGLSYLLAIAFVIFILFMVFGARKK